MNVVGGRYRTFNVFQPMDTLFYRFEWWYPLWFVHWMDTLDDLISNGYSLWFNALSFAMNVVSGRYRTFNVFQPMDTLFYRFEWWYPLWFVHWMNTLDDLISNRYSLWFIFELDSFNGSRVSG